MDYEKMDDPEEVEVDATTSASVLPPGNAAKIAGWIQERTGAICFRSLWKNLIPVTMTSVLTGWRMKRRRMQGRRW